MKYTPKKSVALICSSCGLPKANCRASVDSISSKGDMSRPFGQSVHSDDLERPLVAHGLDPLRHFSYWRKK